MKVNPDDMMKVDPDEMSAFIGTRVCVTQRIPTSQFAYIEYPKWFNSIEEAMAEHKRVLKLYEENGGLEQREWVKVRNGMLVTGECDPEVIDRMNASQRFVINQMKLAIRAHSAEDPVIE